MTRVANQGTLTNWAGNVRFSARELHQPTAVGELQGLVAGSASIRALGTGHSFSPVADSAVDLVSLARLPRRVEIDRDAATVTVSAGLRYGEFGAAVHAAGFALPNTGSLPHISVAGACSTGTHGSGVGNQALAASVAALQMVTADGSLATLRRGEPGFDGSVVALGALGIVTSLTLDLVPTFDVVQEVYDDLPSAALDEHLDDLLGCAYSVSLFTRWGDTVDLTWLKRRVNDPVARTVVDLPSLGARAADGPRHPVPGVSPVGSTEQLGVAGPWFERLPHFRLDFTPSAGEELQSEYLVPRPHAAAAVRAVAELREQLAPVLLVSEIRSVAADDLWLSCAYGRDVVGLHFTWGPDTAAVLPVLGRLEAALAPYDARPHWGKLFTTDPSQVQAKYERLGDFRALMRRYDPSGKLRNEFVDRYVGQ